MNMLTKSKDKQTSYEFVMLEELVKEDHLLRKIDKYIDFNFIYDEVESLYCPDNGRPSIDPVILFKMTLLQYLYGIRSERMLVEEIHHNMAYRWFLGFNITDKIPDHSIFAINRIRRFNDTQVYENIFNRIVEQAISHGLVKGKIVYTDSTHIKANASLSKFENENYIIEEEEDPELLERINEKRESKGQKPLKKKKKAKSKGKRK
jgi:transposase